MEYRAEALPTNAANVKEKKDEFVNEKERRSHALS
jgi:hypothetical protein